MEGKKTLKDKLSRTPTDPGVYLLKGHKDKILYVGKARNLRNRLRTYFQRSGSLDPRKSRMVDMITTFDFIITENELEALALEANLIKQYKPRFNVILRDDKNYPYLKLTVEEQWPRLEVVRKIQRDGALYFGPYVPSQSMWEILAFIRKNFPIRICKRDLDKPMRPCIQHQMGRCGAPCSGSMDKATYMKLVDEVRLFLGGERKELLKNLEKKMLVLSDDLKFEEAARIRDRIRNIEHAWESQRVVAPELGDIDVIGSYSDGVDSLFDIFFVRNGILIGTKDFFLNDIGMLSQGEILRSFIEMFYVKEIIPPGEILAGDRPESVKELEAWLKEKRGGAVRVRTPRRGKKKELLEMAHENAAQRFSDRKLRGDDEILTALKERLSLPRVPCTIGAFDVSTITGSESVGAFICWAKGEFAKDLYRRMKIQSVSGVDDYAMMGEVITRTMKNLAEKVPDLIIVDGGKGQLEVARQVIESNNIMCTDRNRPMLAAVAKDPDRALTLRGDAVDLEEGSPSSLLLKRIRDEVHRFAVGYHRRLRDKRTFLSPLEKIPGIGKKRRLELLRHFDGIEAIKHATIEQIARIKGFDTTMAQRLLDEIRRLGK